MQTFLWLTQSKGQTAQGGRDRECSKETETFLPHPPQGLKGIISGS